MITSSVDIFNIYMYHNITLFAIQVYANENPHRARFFTYWTVSSSVDYSFLSFKSNYNGDVFCNVHLESVVYNRLITMYQRAVTISGALGLCK